jgi:hypothetical protein
VPDDADNHTFDPEQAVATYRQVIERLNAATLEATKVELRATALRLRREWKAWQGEDSLHEMAFGEPED